MKFCFFQWIFCNVAVLLMLAHLLFYASKIVQDLSTICPPFSITIFSVKKEVLHEKRRAAARRIDESNEAGPAAVRFHLEVQLLCASNMRPRFPPTSTVRGVPQLQNSQFGWLQIWKRLLKEHFGLRRWSGQIFSALPIFFVNLNSPGLSKISTFMENLAISHANLTETI